MGLFQDRFCEGKFIVNRVTSRKWLVLRSSCLDGVYGLGLLSCLDGVEGFVPFARARISVILNKNERNNIRIENK